MKCYLFTAEEHATILAHLDSKSKGRKCSICGMGFPSLHNGYGVIPTLGSEDGTKRETIAGGIPFVLTVCKACGHIDAFSTQALGFLPIPEGEPS